MSFQRQYCSQDSQLKLVSKFRMYIGVEGVNNFVKIMCQDIEAVIHIILDTNRSAEVLLLC